MSVIKSTPRIRRIQHSDLAQILAIQAACYPSNLLEEATTFAAKLNFSPASCWLIEVNNEVLGYLFCHPWHGDQAPSLNCADTAWPAQADRFYLHDLAVHPAGRGLNLSALLCEHAFAWAQAQGFGKAMLVAVGEAELFWCKKGFSAAEQQDEKLQQYGKAVLMLKKL